MRSCRVVAVGAVLLLGRVLAAQQSEPEAGLVALRQACLDAATDLVVLNIAAHPDDESSRTMAILRRKYGMRVVTLYTTYGDGGQNAIGREIGPELASLRVRETLRAAAMSGAEVRWLGMPDFGFSKTLEETLQVWGEERVKDAMREQYRRIDPDLVFTNHSLTQGHGHHRASFWAISKILEERAAKGEHVPPLYARCTLEQAQLTMDPSELDTARGETYARLAHRAWTQHVTQGPWGPHNPLQVGKDWWRIVYPEGIAAEVAADLAHWARKRLPAAPLPADAAQMPPADLAREAGAQLTATRALLKQTLQSLSTPGARGLASVLHRRAEALERILLAIANVRAEVWLEHETVPAGGQGKVFVVVHGVDRTKDLSVQCDGVEATPELATVRPTPFDGQPRAATTPPVGTTPAASSNTPTTGDANPAPPAPPPPIPGRLSVPFSCDAAVDGDLPAGPEPRFVEVSVSFVLDGIQFSRLHSLWYTPVAPIELEWDREVLMVQKGRVVERLLSVSVTSHRDRDATTPVRLSMGPGIQAASIPGRLTLTREHNEARILVRAKVDANELTADAGLEIGFRDAKARLPIKIIDVTVPADLKVALVRGPDDTTERVLSDLGIPFRALDRDGLVMARFEDFTTLLLDIRAYHHRPELAEVHDRILQYCRTGGRVVAMYHKPAEWNERAGHPLLAPFPMTIADERVSEEDAAVGLLQPSHRLMQHPHVIAVGDFGGWVQERALNFPKTWDPAWIPMLEMKDKGDEKPHQGALLYTGYGRGDFIYCSLALYRQLRIGNPGAARLLVNLLAK
ncbi:MAG TPA: PIG-L family deacetylase [Planctomycetota bacterium]|nr:PIG-L family deacetylase [Planctomycetota bacterium]